MSKRAIVFIILFLVAFVCIHSNICSAATEYEVASPDGNLIISFELKTKPQPYLPGLRAYYHVTYKGKPILIDSPLGLDFLKDKALDQDFEVVNTSRDAHDSVWENHFGSKLEVRDHYNQLTVSLRERQSPNRRVDLVFRAYDEGGGLPLLPSSARRTEAIHAFRREYGFLLRGGCHSVPSKHSFLRKSL